MSYPCQQQAETMRHDAARLREEANQLEMNARELIHEADREVGALIRAKDGPIHYIKRSHTFYLRDPGVASAVEAAANDDDRESLFFDAAASDAAGVSRHCNFDMLLLSACHGAGDGPQ